MIDIVISKFFRKNNISMDNLNKDLIAYNEDGSRAIAIYDNGNIEKSFYILYLKKQKHEWVNDMFIWIVDKFEKDIDDPMYLMTEGSYFLSISSK